MMSDLDGLVKDIAYDQSIDILTKHLGNQDEDILMIVANAGIHHLPSKIPRGEIYYARQGNLDFSSIDMVNEQFEEILKNVSIKLKQHSWKDIYLIPFSHSILCIQIKSLVYQITRIETTDLFYDGKGNYSDLKIEQRSLIANSPNQ
jgi:hypothetical protein